MHIYYETHLYEAKVVDISVKREIRNKEMAELTAKNVVGMIEKRIVEYQSEKDTITNATAKFAVFLQKNAIAPYNDSYKEYLGYLIDR